MKLSKNIVLSINDNQKLQDAIVTAKAKVDPSDNPVDVVFELHEPSSLLCRAAFVIATDTEAFVKEFWTSGTHSVSFR